jgi:hypothetical protein
LRAAPPETPWSPQPAAAQLERAAQPAAVLSSLLYVPPVRVPARCTRPTLRGPISLICRLVSEENRC